MALVWRFGACSDIGRTRRKNDDSAYAGPHLIVVADGMGGAAAGDLASSVAVQTLQRLDDTPQENLLEALAGTLHRANDRLAELIEQDPSVAGMGTTVTAALFNGECMGVAHLGDSRGYLWRDGELMRLTEDHTWVQTLVDEGRITEAEARVHSHRSLLLKVLDGQHHHDPDLALYDVHVGDRILLCSDGLSGFVGTDRMADVLASTKSADAAAAELTRAALKAASNDNITVVVADVLDAAPAAATPIVVGAAAQPVRAPKPRVHAWPHREQQPVGKSLLTDPHFDPEELRYAPRPPRRFSALRRVGALLLLLAIIVVAGFVAYDWSQNQYYVAQYRQRVAIYRGVEASLPGVPLHSVYRAEPLLLSELPSFRRSQVLEGMPADSLQHARRIVGNLRSFARVCARLVSRTSAAPTTRQPQTSPTPTGATASTRQPTKKTRSSATHSPGKAGRRQHPTVRAKSSSGHRSPGPSGTSPRTSSTTTPKPGTEQARECAGATPATTAPSAPVTTQ